MLRREGCLMSCRPGATYWGLVAASALARQSSTALLQSSFACRSTSGIFTSMSVMHGGTASEHVLRHTFAAAPLPHSSSATAVWQQAFLESCPRTLLQVS